MGASGRVRSVPLCSVSVLFVRNLEPTSPGGVGLVYKCAARRNRLIWSSLFSRIYTLAIPKSPSTVTSAYATFTWPHGPTTKKMKNRTHSEGNSYLYLCILHFSGNVAFPPRGGCGLCRESVEWRIVGTVGARYLSVGLF